MARLPTPGGDDGTWGDILNQYLLTAHNADGTLSGSAVGGALPDGSITNPKIVDGTITEAKLDAAAQAKLNAVGSGDPAMGGDLTGTASTAQIAAGVIVDADVSGTAAIAQSKIANLPSDLASKEPTIAAGTTAQYYRGDKSWQTLDKTAVGLANADNTSDANKPISTATQTALNGKANTVHTHAIADTTNLQTSLNSKADNTITVTGTTSLTGGGDLTANRTLSLVGDAATPGSSKYYGTDGTGTKGYFAIPTGDPAMGGDLTGTASNAQIAAGAIVDADISATAAIAQSKIQNLTTDLANKQTADTDLATIAGLTPVDNDIIQRKAGAWTNRTPAQFKTDLSLTKTDVGLGSVDNTSDASKPISTAAQTALNAKADNAITVTGATSLTGGGDLTANRTVSLVNDAATPGNSRYYGTNGSGTKGFFALPTGSNDRRWQVGTGETVIDEFNDSLLDPAWVRVDGANAPAANVTWTEGADVLSALQTSADTGNAFHALLRPIGTAPVAGDAFITCMTLHGIPGTSYSVGGICVTDGTTYGTGTQVVAESYFDVSTPIGLQNAMSQYSNFTGSISGTVFDKSPAGAKQYMRLVYIGSNQWRYDRSPDSVSWIKSASNITVAGFTPTHVGLQTRKPPNTNNHHVVTFEFLRRVSGIS